VTVALVLVARRFFPRPQELSAGPAEVSTSGLPRVFWIYLTAAAFAAAGFADFSLISFHFAQAHTVSAPLVPVFYVVAMAVSGTGSLIFGKLYDRAEIGVLIPLTAGAAVCAPLVFLGGMWPALGGMALWGIGMGVQESIVPAAVAPLVAPDRRASAYGLFTGIYGTGWLLGSVAIEALFSVSLGAVTVFAVACQVAALPFLFAARRRMPAGLFRAPALAVADEVRADTEQAEIGGDLSLTSEGRDVTGRERPPAQCVGQRDGSRGRLR